MASKRRPSSGRNERPTRRGRPAQTRAIPRKAEAARGGGHATRPIREDLVLQACLEAYALVRQEQRLADRALEQVLRAKKHLYSNERRAVAERVYGLLRRQLTVDYLLARARPAFEKLETTRKNMLRICASRVLHGEEPDTVSDGSKLQAEDAITLRRLPDAAADLEGLPFEERFPIAASMPPFLAKLFLEEFGEDAVVAAEAMNERAPLTARVNGLKVDRDALIVRLREDGIECRPTPLSPLGVFLETRVNAFSLEAFKDGFFELQDEGSQLLGMLVDPPPTKVVDACAGAGGKTLQLAVVMKNRGELFALDVDERRLEELRRRARRAGVHNARVRQIATGGEEAAKAIEDLAGKADRVLVDAPCSGTGTFRRKPDARYRLGPDDLAMHVARQKDLIARFATMVKPGGRLIYGTCSILRAENEDVIADFLAKHPEFSVRPISEELGEKLGKEVSRDGFLRLFPHKHGTDGFFGAVLVKAK